MEKQEEIIKKRTEKIITWFKNPYNLAFFLIILATIAIRLYFFILTKNQPVWWDESEYLNMAKSWAFGNEYKFYDPVRPILFSLVSAVFFKISNTEFLPRIFMLILSIFSVVGVYFLGKELYNKKIGLLSAFFSSFFYLNLFFTYRLQVDMPSLTFFLFSVFFFYKYFKTKSKKSLYLASALIAIGTLFKQSTAFVLLGILIYLLITEKLKFLMKKEIWIAGLIFIIIQVPYIIWGYVKFGGFIFLKASAVTAPENYFLEGFNVLKEYIKLFPTYFPWSFLIVLIIGLIFMYRLFLGFDLLFKEDNKKLKRDLYVLLLLLVPIIMISLLISHNENRYLINTFPIVFIIASYSLIKIYNFIKKINKNLPMILLILFLSFFVINQIKGPGHADDLIKNKVNSYLEIKQAGLWLKENSVEGDIIMTHSGHQITYYSERESLFFTATKEDFESLLSSNKQIKYFLISMIQQSPEWTYSYPQEESLEAIQVYFADYEQTQPVLVIYKL